LGFAYVAFCSLPMPSLRYFGRDTDAPLAA
jgi:hypothetical protein